MATLKANIKIIGISAELRPQTSTQTKAAANMASCNHNAQHGLLRILTAMSINRGEAHSTLRFHLVQ